MVVRRQTKKIPVEKLQEQHLTGPAQDPIEDVAKDLQEDQVVVVHQMPQYEKVIFRNQRDPGIPLEFHYSSKTHPFKMYKLIDGQTYDLPKEVIRNLEGCKRNVYKYRKNSEGLPEAYVAGHHSHFMCERAAS